MKQYIIVFGLILACLSQESYGQQSFRFSQYFQNPLTVNPAFAGVEGFVDLKIGYRQQWSGIEDAPETYFVSAHGALRKREQRFGYQQNSLRISDPSVYRELSRSGINSFFENITHGLGGYVVNDRQGIFNQTSAMLNYALHYKMGNTVLTLGVGGGVINRELDVSGITLGDQENVDPTYQAYLAQQGMITDLDVNAGLLLRNERFFLGYSVKGLLQSELYATVDEISTTDQLRHYGMLGVRLPISSSLMVIPGAFVSYSELEPTIFDVNLRLRYQDLFWLGASYRNVETVVAMAGVNISDVINLSYAYDYGYAEVNNLSSGIHEVVLGFMLFNSNNASPYMW
ncbi:MAG: type IX secretion system membrane protein PorP/SprF [Cyclobacteriaceae bacterium]